MFKSMGLLDSHTVAKNAPIPGFIRGVEFIECIAHTIGTLNGQGATLSTWFVVSDTVAVIDASTHREIVEMVPHVPEIGEPGRTTHLLTLVEYIG